MCDGCTIINKQSKNNVVIFPSTEQSLRPKESSIFGYHIKYLMECAEDNDWSVINYFLEKALESWHGIEV